MRIRFPNQIDLEDIMMRAAEVGHEVDPLAKMISSAVIVDDNEKFVAYGQVKLIPEAVVLFSKESTTKQRVQSLHGLLKAGKHVTYKELFSKLYVFTEDKKFATYLEHNEGFKEIPEKVLTVSL